MKKPELKVWWWESKEGIKLEAHCTGRADGRLRINRRSRFTAKMNRDLGAFPRWQDMLALVTGMRWNMGLQRWESLGEESPLGPLTDRWWVKGWAWAWNCYCTMEHLIIDRHVFPPTAPNFPDTSLYISYFHKIRSFQKECLRTPQNPWHISHIPHMGTRHRIPAQPDMHAPC